MMIGGGGGEGIHYGGGGKGELQPLLVVCQAFITKVPPPPSSKPSQPNFFLLKSVNLSSIVTISSKLESRDVCVYCRSYCVSSFGSNRREEAWTSK